MKLAFLVVNASYSSFWLQTLSFALTKAFRRVSFYLLKKILIKIYWRNLPKFKMKGIIIVFQILIETKQFAKFVLFWYWIKDRIPNNSRIKKSDQIICPSLEEGDLEHLFFLIVWWFSEKKVMETLTVSPTQDSQDLDELISPTMSHLSSWGS